MNEVDMSDSMQSAEGQKSAPTVGESESWRQIKQDLREEIMAEIREGIRELARGNGRENNRSQQKKQRGLVPTEKANLVPAEDVWTEVSDTAPNMMPMFSGYIYALGTVSCHFPNLSLEKEYVQAQAAVAEEISMGAMTDRQRYYTVFSYSTEKKGNSTERKPYFYIAQEMCWVLSIENIHTYILQPRGDEQLWQLIDMLDKPFVTPPMDVDVVIGVRGPIAPAEMCNGLQLPIVAVSNTYSFPVEQFVQRLPRPENISETTFQTVATETFYRAMQLADNVGNMDEHRAINYVVLQYPNIYTMTAEQALRNNKLNNVEVKPSPLSENGARPVMNVIFTFASATTNAKEKFFTEVDVSGMYPFLVQTLQPYYGN